MFLLGLYIVLIQMTSLFFLGIFKALFSTLMVFHSQKMATFGSPSPSTKVKPLSPFVSKLKLLLSDPKYQDAIRWSGNGDAIVIFDADTFKRVILDKTAEMFKTKNFTSFVRQLNLYGFRKVPTNGKSDPNKNMKFEHPHFVQHKPQMMHLVQRTCSSSKKRKTAEVLDQFSNEREEHHSQAKAVKKNESHAREKAAWLNEYYTRATKKKANKMPSPSPKEEASYQGEKTFDDDERFALEYMYRKFREEQHAVQLLMYLKYSQPNPEVFPRAVWGPQFPHLQGSYFVPHSTSQQFCHSNMSHYFGCRPIYEQVETDRAD